MTAADRSAAPLPARTLVTGGAGFLGGHLARALLARGAAVTVLDDLSAPSSLALPAHDALRTVVGDVRDAAAVERAAEGCTHLVHMASVVGVDAVLADPARTAAVIRDGTARVWALARARELPLLFLSSSEVTDAPRRGPRAVYARAKAAAEQALLGDPRAELATVLRPFNVVGPGQTAPGMVLPALARAALAGAPLPLHGDGRQRRGFLHVLDFTDALLALLPLAPRSGGRVLEIGADERVSVGELAARLCALTGRPAPAPGAPAPRAREDLPRRAPRLDALRALLPFAPRRDLDRVLRDVLAELRASASPAPPAGADAPLAAARA